MIRDQLDKNNNLLNELNVEIADLDTTVKGYTRRVVMDSKSFKAQSNNDGGIIDLVANTSSATDTNGQDGPDNNPPS